MDVALKPCALLVIGGLDIAALPTSDPNWKGAPWSKPVVGDPEPPVPDPPPHPARTAEMAMNPPKNAILLINLLPPQEVSL